MLNIKKEIRKVTRSCQDGVNKVNKEVNSGVSKVKKESNNAFHKVEDLSKKSIVEIKSTTDKALKEVKQELNEVKKVATKATNEIESKTTSAISEIEKSVTDKLPEIINELAEKLSQVLSKEGLTLVKKVVEATYDGLASAPEELKDALNIPSVSIELAVCTLKFDGFYSRAENMMEILDQYIQAPPKITITDITKMIESLGPSEISIDANIEMALVICSTNILKIGAGVDEIPMSLATYIVSKILKVVGVPES